MLMKRKNPLLQLRIPMVGSRDTGFLNVFALKTGEPPVADFRVALLQLELTGQGDTVTIYDTRQWVDEF